MTLIWKGDLLKVKFASAQKFGINKTMAQAVVHAKRNHTWGNITGTLEGSISIATYAIPFGNGFRGDWGSKDVVYALIHELGGRIVPKKASALRFQVNGSWVTTQEVNIPARPYLRPAADATYPGLARNIKEGLKLA